MITAAQRHVLYHKPVPPGQWPAPYGLAPYCHVLRQWVESGTAEHIRLWPSGTLEAMDCDEAHDGPAPTGGVREFIRIKVEASAPFTGGRPLVYQWYAAIDDLGHVLSGEARLVPMPPDWNVDVFVPDGLDAFTTAVLALGLIAAAEDRAEREQQRFHDL
jgi:hypothetical protein